MNNLYIATFIVCNQRSTMNKLYPNMLTSLCHPIVHLRQLPRERLSSNMSRYKPAFQGIALCTKKLGLHNAVFCQRNRYLYTCFRGTRRPRQLMGLCSLQSRFDICSVSENVSVRTIPVLRDNYAYLLMDKQHNVAAAVDPVEPTKVLRAAEEEGVRLVAVLTTHKHWDHSGGNEELLEKYPSLKIYASKYETVPGMTHGVGQGDVFQFHSPSCLDVYVYCTPCHTRGHLLYFVKERNSTSNAHPILFSGDTLFIGGCGRFFEGSSEDMLKNIEQVIKRFPGNTLMFCGHEYTLKNLEFALLLEPNNQILKNKYNWAKQQRQLGKYTVPSTLAEEFQYNPFLRYNEVAIQKAVEQTEPTRVLAALRKQKDIF